MNQNASNETQKDKQADGIIETPPSDGAGIIGDTTNHDLFMTRIWIRDNICENIVISVLGSEFTKARTQKVEKQLKGKKLDDIELIIGLKSLRFHAETEYTLDALFESIYRAINDYHSRQEAKSAEIAQAGKVTSENETKSDSEHAQ